ncbi:MAG TPA: class I SAM-dependent methyltransferase [Methanospirillum sp.]|nr:class I SAM-dependent methyltransferase [Methanospirillum sp.]
MQGISPTDIREIDTCDMTPPDIQRSAWNSRYLRSGRQWGNAPSEFSLTPNVGVILEAGVGDGKNLRVRPDQGEMVMGFDFAESAIRLCRADPTLTHVHLFIGDLRAVPLKRDSVDLIYAHHILGHLDEKDLGTAIQEVSRILKPAGSIALTVFSQYDMRYNSRKQNDSGIVIRGDGIITRFFTFQEIRVLFENFSEVFLNRNQWSLKVRGVEHVRSVITGLYKKSF